LTAFWFSLLVWVFVVAVQLIQQRWFYEPFSHVDFPPFSWRVDDVGMVAFAISALSFFLWQLERES
jgi:hypothetical protein